MSDITQNLAVLGFVPTSLLGPQVGFHVLQAILFAFIRGDTNSVAGVACTALALFGSHAARRGRVVGLPLLVLGLTLTAYSHAGSLAYAVAYLAVEALFYRDVRSAAYACPALAIAIVASLPQTWELLRHSANFDANNLGPGPAPPFEWSDLARRIYYNVEILFRPGRWTNDYNPHRNMDARQGGQSEPSAFSVHFESLLPPPASASTQGTGTGGNGRPGGPRPLLPARSGAGRSPIRRRRPLLPRCTDGAFATRWCVAGLPLPTWAPMRGLSHDGRQAGGPTTSSSMRTRDRQACRRAEPASKRGDLIRNVRCPW